MPTAVQEDSKEIPHTNRDTGFPEPFSADRNTTLPHPDADTSKNASISGPDVPYQRTHSRSRSFLGRHHSPNHKNGGAITVEGSGLYDNIQYADGTEEVRGSKVIEKNGAMVENVVETQEVKEEGMDGAEDERDEHGHRSEDKKKGILRKIGLH